MSKQTALRILFSLLPLSVFAQVSLYFDKDLLLVKSPEPYTYTGELRQYTNGMVGVKIFDTNRIPVTEGLYSVFGESEKDRKREGMHRFYRPGQKIPWYQQEFKAGVAEGDLSSWYPTGEVKRIEHFHEGKSVGGECFARDGSPIPFTPFSTVPEFPGGPGAYEAFLKKNLKYPDEAYEYGIEGNAVIYLYIDKDGTHSNIYMRLPDQTLYTEIERITSKMPFITPGKKDDEIAPAYLEITIPFNLQTERQNRKKAPGNKRFDLIQDVIDTGNRFYLDSTGSRVANGRAYSMYGIAKKLTDTTVQINYYDRAGTALETRTFTHFNKLFERELIPADGKNGTGTAKALYDSGDETLQSPPEFPGGEIEMFKYLARTMHYPTAAKEANISGFVKISFVVNTIGRITDVKLVRDIGGGCGAEVVRVFKAMPLWTPGKVNGFPVKVRMTAPIRFQLD